MQSARRGLIEYSWLFAEFLLLVAIGLALFANWPAPADFALIFLLSYVWAYNSVLKNLTPNPDGDFGSNLESSPREFESEPTGGRRDETPRDRDRATDREDESIGQSGGGLRQSEGGVSGNPAARIEADPGPNLGAGGNDSGNPKDEPSFEQDLERLVDSEG